MIYLLLPLLLLALRIHLIPLLLVFMVVIILRTFLGV
jgi:hypothetical protein